MARPWILALHSWHFSTEVSVFPVMRWLLPKMSQVWRKLDHSLCPDIGRTLLHVGYLPIAIVQWVYRRTCIGSHVHSCMHASHLKAHDVLHSLVIKTVYSSSGGDGSDTSYALYHLPLFVMWHQPYHSFHFLSWSWLYLLCDMLSIGPPLIYLKCLLTSNLPSQRLHAWCSGRWYLAIMKGKFVFVYLGSRLADKA